MTLEGAFRELAAVIDRLRTDGYEVTAVSPGDNGLLAEGDLCVSLRVTVPARLPAVAAGDVEWASRDDADGPLVEEVAVRIPVADAGADGDVQDGTAGGTDDFATLEDREVADAEPQPSGEADASGKGDSSGEADASGEGNSTGEADDIPPYKDPDRLAAVYERFDSFAAMTEHLDVDVTPQTVRRHMIEHGIHDPQPREGDGESGTESEVGTDGESGTDGEGETDSEAEPHGEEHSDSETEPDDRAKSGGRRDPKNEDKHDEGAGGEDRADQSGDRGSNGERADRTDADQPADAGGGPGGNGRGGATPEAASGTGTEEHRPGATEPTHDTQVSTDTRVSTEAEVSTDTRVSTDALPAGLTVGEVVEAVRSATTLHEVGNALGTERDRTRELLEELGLLDLVTGRLAEQSEVTASVAEIEDRIRKAPGIEIDQGPGSDSSGVES